MTKKPFQKKQLQNSVMYHIIDRFPVYIKASIETQKFWKKIKPFFRIPHLSQYCKKSPTWYHQDSNPVATPRTHQPYQLFTTYNGS
jgi:hypothetical protein